MEQGSLEKSLIKEKSEDKLELKKKMANTTREFKGLCRNCDKRENCDLPKPAEGVWDCDEYR